MAIRTVFTGGSVSVFDYRCEARLVLGITCHAVYHAGQIQRLKRLNAGD